MHVNLILHPDHGSWIIEKMAQRVVDYAPSLGFSATISPQPDPNADVNHWMSYAFANEKSGTPSTVFITHVDDALKLAYLTKALAERVDLGICMSSYTVEELSHRGVPRSSLCYVLPGHDGDVAPRRITVGFTTRLYRDGRKREDLLLRLAKEVPLDAYRFEIHGAGWDKVVPKLAAAGAEVDYFPGTDDYLKDYRSMIAAIPNFDYYVYLGLDEGSLGTLDALAAGVRTIVTPQGFHVDLQGGITHSVWDYEDLQAIFKQIAGERESRITSVRHLNWAHNVEQHAIIWRALLAKDIAKLDELLSADADSHQAKAFRMVSGAEFAARGRSLTRIFTTLGRHPRLQGLRKSFRGASK
jgi:hypothetical protein